MRNILLVINTPGGEIKDNTIALVPEKMLEGVNLPAINNKMVNADELSAEVSDTIVSLYKRLGLEAGGHDADLSEYVNPSAPFTVDQVVQFGWAV